jgi:hypothetical protein
MTAPDQPATMTERMQRRGYKASVGILDLPARSIGGNTKMLIARCYASGLPIDVGLSAGPRS